MREMVIDSIRVSLLNYSRIVILKEKDAERLQKGAIEAMRVFTANPLVVASGEGGSTASDRPWGAGRAHLGTNPGLL